MKNVKENKKIPTINDILNNEQKVLDLCLCYQIEDSKNWMRIIEQEIKIYTLQRETLLLERPHKFQKNKMKRYNNKIQELDSKICDKYKSLEEEMLLIINMQSLVIKDISKN